MIAGDLREVARCRGAAVGLLADGGDVLFCAPDENRIYRYEAGSGAVSVDREYTGRISGLARSSEGTVFAAQSGSRRVVVLEPDGRMTLPAERLDGLVHNHPAQLSVDASGRVWFSDPHSSVPAPGAQVHPAREPAILRLSRDHQREWRLQRMTFDALDPYGVQVASDGASVFVTTGRQNDLRVYPVRSDGTLGDHRVLHLFDVDRRGGHRGGRGITWDDGLLLVCAGSPGEGPGPLVYAFEPSGRIIGTAVVPESPTCCAVTDGRLYVTTASGGLYEAPYAGRTSA